MAGQLRIFPFMPGGSAEGSPLARGSVALTDLTASLRFGLKGPGSADWLSGQGLSLPAINRIGTYRDLRVLRLGGQDIMLLGENPSETLAKLTLSWHDDPGPKGYSSWREEGWAWMRLSGPGLDAVMSRLCALDLRLTRFGEEEIAQTRVGHVESVIFRAGDAFDVLFDVTASAFFARMVATTAKHATWHHQMEGTA